MPMLRSDLELVETYTNPAGRSYAARSSPWADVGTPNVLPEDLAG